ncbi:MAG: response regulator transcription factor [Flavobacteriales bacterium]
MINNPPATLLLVDDQAMLLDGMEALLATMPLVQVVGRSASGLEAVQKAALLKPELVLMDVNMPGMDGIEATKRLLKVSPESRVLMLSMYGHKEFVLEVMEAGAYGYLLKNSGKSELIAAFTAIKSGNKYIAQELATLMESSDRYKDREGANQYGALSKREVQVVKLILQEHTNQEIASVLFISTDTVETHRRNIMHKLDVRNTAGLVKYALERGWAD